MSRPEAASAVCSSITVISIWQVCSQSASILLLDWVADVDDLVRVARRLGEEVALADVVRLEALVAVLGMVEREVREGRSFGRGHGDGAVVRVLFVGREGVPREEDVRPVLADGAHALLSQFVERRVARQPSS